MFQSFSSRYLLGNLRAYSTDRQDAALNQILYESALDYVAGPPLIVKIDNKHFTVYGDANISYGNLAIPDTLLKDLSVSLSEQPESTTVMIARDKQIGDLLSLTS